MEKAKKYDTVMETLGDRLIELMLAASTESRARHRWQEAVKSMGASSQDNRYYEWQKTVNELQFASDNFIATKVEPQAEASVSSSETPIDQSPQT